MAWTLLSDPPVRALLKIRKINLMRFTALSELAFNLEKMQESLMMYQCWEAARSLDGSIELIRKEAELAKVEYTNRYEHGRV